MKTFVILFLLSIAVPAIAQPTNDVVAIFAAVPGVTRIAETANGYRLETSSGVRTAYRTSTGYRIEGGRGASSVQIIRTSTGYRIEDARARANALRVLAK